MLRPPAILRSTRTRGLDVETLAAGHLTAHGLRLVARNFRARCGEIDLICSDAGLLVIVEVRHRASAAFGGSLASVTARKQRRIVRTTQVFLQQQSRWRSCRLRFDVVGVDGPTDGTHYVTWVRDAFRADAIT